ncbi:MAG: quinoprotein dehydrogenase-associated putative ABC transporter substrate-binding protein [Hyphomicrobiaceae bacterium]
MSLRLASFICLLALVGPFKSASAESPDLSFAKSKPYDQLSSAEISAAKAAAKKKKIDQIVFCADPGNMPLSNNKAEGFQNKIAMLVAEKLGARGVFFWRPYIDRGLTRQTFDNHECDVLLDMPVGPSTILLTNPIYRSTYVLAYRSDRGHDFKSLDDPKLKQLKIGVFQHSAMRQALSRRGINPADVHIITQDADLRPENQPWRQVQKVVDGKLDIAAVWGPIAGFVKTMKGAPLVIQPANLMEHEFPLEFSLAMGIQKTDVVVKFMLDAALEAARPEIQKILSDFGVPLVLCSECVIPGDLPSHGSYLKEGAEFQERYLKSTEAILPSKNATPDQVVTQERVDAWLAQGVDPSDELANAVLSGDPNRVTYLLSKGANVNKPDLQGMSPMHIAAKSRHSDLLKILIDNKADPNIQDRDGMTPLLYAVMRNHVPSIEVLRAGGADLAKPGRDKHSPLLIALGEGSYFAARALLYAGASPSEPSGPEQMTPLMTAATQVQVTARVNQVARGPSPIELADQLIKLGADANAKTTSGITALMIAAGHDNAPMIGLLIKAGADPAVKAANGKTAMQIAESGGFENAIKMLKRLTAPSGTADR